MTAGRGCLLVAVAGLALAGCSGGSTAPSGKKASSPAATATPTPGALPAGGTLPDPCALVTTTQVATALGSAIGGTGRPSTLSAPLAGKTCTWSTVSTPVRDVVISVRSDSTITEAGESAAVLFAQDIGNLSAAQGLTAVAGIGDRAYVGYGTTGSYNAHVLKRDVLMDVVGLYGSAAGTPATQAQFLTFVKAAGSRL